MKRIKSFGHFTFNCEEVESKISTKNKVRIEVDTSIKSPNFSLIN
jgi:hypothetical protein